MPAVVKDTADLSVGNGFLYVASSVAALPAIGLIKQKFALGGAGGLAGFMGAMKADAVLTVTRMMSQFKTGVPQVVVKQLVVDENAMFKCQLAELNLADYKKQLAGGILTTSSGGATVYDQTAVLTGLAEMVLDQVPLASPAPVVTDCGATPVTYTEGPSSDYVIDYTLGTIRRPAGSTIPSGETVCLGFSYTALPSETLTVGGSCSVDEFALRFVHLFCDSNRVFAATFYKAVPNGTGILTFRETDYANRDVEYQALADTTRGAGDQIASLFLEHPAT